MTAPLRGVPELQAAVPLVDAVVVVPVGEAADSLLSKFYCHCFSLPRSDQTLSRRTSARRRIGLDVLMNGIETPNGEPPSSKVNILEKFA